MKLVLFSLLLFMSTSSIAESRSADVFRAFMKNVSKAKNYERITPWDGLKTTYLAVEVKKLRADKWKFSPFIQCGSNDSCPGMMQGWDVFFIKNGIVFQGDSPSRPVEIKIDLELSDENRLVIVDEVYSSHDDTTHTWTKTWKFSDLGGAKVLVFNRQYTINGAIESEELIRFKN